MAESFLLYGVVSAVREEQSGGFCFEAFPKRHPESVVSGRNMCFSHPLLVTAIKDKDTL
jgi:hypothetical protein